VPLVQQEDGSSVRVGDVASVTKGLTEPVRILDFHEGRRSVTVGAFLQPNQRVDKWAERARAVVADFSADMSDPIAVEIVFDQSLYTVERLGGLTRNLGFSALIVFIVLFLAMGWRAAFVVGTALPLTVCLVLILFNLFGMPLHQMSVTGLVISLGLLIDNAIVVVDDFDQLRARGAGRLEAIDRSLKHLFGPLFASTLTTALAFAPIALLPGSAGEFVGMVGISVIFAVCSSFLISMSVVPAMAGWFDRKRAHEGGRVVKRRWWRDGIAIDTVTDGYRYTVGAVLHFPPLGLLIGIIPALAGFYLAGQLPSQFFPQTERDQFQVEIALPADASILATRQAVEKAAGILASYDEITSTHFTLGEPSPRVYYNMVNSTRGLEAIASGWAETSSAQATREIIADVQAKLRREFSSAQVLALPFEQGPPSDAPIQFLIAGDDLQTLSRLGDEARRILAATPGVTYTSASLELGTPTLVLQADEAASALAGHRLTSLAGELNAELEGVFAGSILEGVEELPVRVIGPDARRGELDDLRAKTFGGGAPLSALGELTLDPQVATITRRDGQRVNDIRAYLEPYTLPAPVFADFRARLDAAGFELPRGYELLIGGEAENSSDALADLAATGVPLILVIAGAVALVFNSFRMSLLILSAGFLSVGLAFFGVWLFNLPMGFNAILGALGLLGIAINGSIVVLSMLRASPRAMADDVIAQRETVVDATRHIVATTLTTMGGFVPLLITADAFWMPLAAAISGGVAGSALLALYFTPAVFRLTTMKPFTRLGRSLGILTRPGSQPAQ
jgi:multidrug efflux pump subunit AcrB